MTWGLLEPLDHSHLGAIVSMLETLIKSHVFFHSKIYTSIDLSITYGDLIIILTLRMTTIHSSMKKTRAI